MADKLKKVSKAHTRYYLADGTLVPGATTVTGLLNKPALVKWANNLGLQGIDSNRCRQSGERSELIHTLVECHITGKEVDCSDYTLSKSSWRRTDSINTSIGRSSTRSSLSSTRQSSSPEKYKYGGTLDFYCKVDGKYTLVDFKSGKGIFNEHFLQTSGYANLLREQKHKVEQIMILNIGRNEDEPFQTETIPLPTTEKKYFNMFKALLKVYYIKKELGLEVTV